MRRLQGGGAKELSQSKSALALTLQMPVGRLLHHQHCRLAALRLACIPPAARLLRLAGTFVRLVGAGPLHLRLAVPAGPSQKAALRLGCLGLAPAAIAPLGAPAVQTLDFLVCNIVPSDRAWQLHGKHQAHASSLQTGIPGSPYTIEAPPRSHKLAEDSLGPDDPRNWHPEVTKGSPACCSYPAGAQASSAPQAASGRLRPGTAPAGGMGKQLIGASSTQTRGIQTTMLLAL